MAPLSGFTDFTPACGTISQSLYQMLARCIVYENRRWHLNTIWGLADCEDLHSFWTCENNHLDPEKALVDNIFAYDECGHLAVKIMIATDIGGQPG